MTAAPWRSLSQAGMQSVLSSALRGSVSLALPPLLGLWTGHVIPAVLAGIGALWAVGQDGSLPYRLRMPRLLAVGVASAVGLLIGELALRGAGHTAVAGCLAGCAVIAGLIGLRGPIRSVIGLHLLLGVIVGGEIALPSPWWLGPLALLAGALLVTVLSTGPWLWRSNHLESEAVFAAYRDAAATLAAVGTPQAEAARRSLTLSLNQAHEILAPRLAAQTRRESQTVTVRRLLAALHVAVCLGEVVAALVWEARSLPAPMADLPLEMAWRLIPGRSGVRTRVTDAPAGRTQRELAADSAGTRALINLYKQAEARASEVAVLSLPDRPRPTRTAHLRYAVLLAAEVLVAYVVGLRLHDPHGYWLPLTVAFIHKPDFGPILRRALNRSAGTVIGVTAIGALALVTSQSPYALVATVAVAGAVVAVGVRFHYAVATIGVTMVVFVLIELLGGGQALYGTRILDTVVAAVIALAAHFVVWPDSAASRADTVTAAAMVAVQRYQDQGPSAAPAKRHALRRAAYQGLADARKAGAYAHAERTNPPRRKPPAGRSPSSPPKDVATR